MRPGPSAGITVEQHQPPGPHVGGEPGGQLVGAPVDPGPDPGEGVVTQEIQIGEGLGDPDAGGGP
jgi:hypothetical protein